MMEYVKSNPLFKEIDNGLLLSRSQLIFVLPALDVMKELPKAGDVNRWFPPVRQAIYIESLVERYQLTHLQATCFVRLWGYGHLQKGNQTLPIDTLDTSIPTFSCSQQQAASLIYCDRKGGGVRHAGQLINRLAQKNCLHREPFDGGPARLHLNIPQDLKLRVTCHSVELDADALDLEQDETSIASFVTGIYNWVNPEESAPSPSYKVIQVLRRWATLCPAGLRVLRKREDSLAVGFAAFFPVHPDAEERLYLSPSSGLHLITLAGPDPFQVAEPGDEQCYAIFVRSWMLEIQYWNYSYVCQFLRDSQETLKVMQKSFPNIRTLHTISIHPALDKLALQIGFKMDKHFIGNHRTDTRRWLRTPLKHFLALDIDEVMAEFDFSTTDFV